MASGRAFKTGGPARGAVTLLDDRVARPLHKGTVPGANRGAEVGNPACGDVLVMHVRLAGDCVEAAGFECLGSPFQQAVASILCEEVTGMQVSAARSMREQELLDLMPDLPARHRHLVRLSLDALRSALA